MSSTFTRPQTVPTPARHTLRPGGRVLLVLLALLLTQIQVPVVTVLCAVLGFLIHPAVLIPLIAALAFYLFVTRRSTR